MNGDNFFTWQNIRGVGELQLLTRASYAMLILVPILVGIWPSVRVVINAHNRVLEQTTKDLAGVAERLDHQANLLASTTQRATAATATVVSDETVASVNDAMAGFVSKIGTFSKDIEEALEKLKREGTLSPWLPATLALSFFAALAVTVGHLIYQSQAPSIVRQHKMMDYIREQRAAFAEQADEDAFQAALKKSRKEWAERNLNYILDPPRAHSLKFSPMPREAEHNGHNHNVPYYRSQGDDFLYKKYMELYNNVSDMFRKACSELSRLLYPDSYPDLRTDDGSPRMHQGALALDRHFELRGKVRLLHWYDVQQLINELQDFLKDHRWDEMSLRNPLNNLVASIFESEFERSSQTLERKRDLIGDMARQTYIEESYRKRSLIVLSLSLYILGGLIVLQIIGMQSIAIMTAAGWV